KLGGGEQLVAVGRIGDALESNASHEIVQFGGDAQDHAVPHRLRVNRNVGKAPGIEQLLQRLADVGLVQRIANVERQQAVQFVAGKWLRGGFEIDPLDGAAFQNLCSLTRRRYGAEQQRQE